MGGRCTSWVGWFVTSVGENVSSPAWTVKLASEDEDPSTVQAIYEVFLDAMGRLDRGDSGWIYRRLAESDALALCRDADGALVGYGFYLCPKSFVNGSQLLWCNAVAIRKRWQNFGVVRGLDERVAQWLNVAPRWLGCRTQNPRVVAAYSDLGWCWPMDETFDTALGVQLLDLLRAHVPEVGLAVDLDPATGVCRRVYQGGRLGDSSSLAHRPHVDRLLANIELMTSAGDALVIVTDWTTDAPERL
jgi:hypothetical protein